jgi:hypothetical protein
VSATTAAPARRRSWDPTALALGLFGAVTVVLWVVGYASQTLLPPDPLVRQVELLFVGDGIVGVWTQWDAGWYLSIAREGYSFVSVDRQANVAFFPAYPLAMRAIGWVLGGHPLVGGVLVTLGATAGSVVLFTRWCADRMPSLAVRWAVAALLLYPYAWYLYGAVYADALFLVAALGAFVLYERGHPVLAGLAGAVATAARPVGMAVVVGLVILVLARRRGLRRLRLSDAGVLLSAGGLAGWMAYLWVRFGDPLLFSKVQSAWGQASGPETWFKVDLFRRAQSIPCFVRGTLGSVEGCGTDYGSELLYALGIIAQGVLLLAAVLSVPWIIRRFGWAYGAYTVVVLAPALIGSQDFQGAGRYLLAAFPVFALVGERLSRHATAGRWVLGASALVLVLLTSLYARGYYLA